MSDIALDNARIIAVNVLQAGDEELQLTSDNLVQLPSEQQITSRCRSMRCGCMTVFALRSSERRIYSAMAVCADP